MKKRRKKLLLIFACTFIGTIQITGCGSAEHMKNMELLTSDIEAVKTVENIPQQDIAETEPEEVYEIVSHTPEGNASDTWNQAMNAILSVQDKAFFAGYPIDESFLFWLMEQYGEQSLIQIAKQVQTATADVWYQTVGASLHVLWLDYCEQVGLHPHAWTRVTRQTCASEEQTVLSFTGDMNFDDRTGTMQQLKTEGISSVLSADVQELMKSSDIMMINNECTFSTRGVPLPGKAYTFRSNPANVSILKELGVDIAGIANNHVWDYGAEAVTDTIATLDDAGIANVGAGNNLEEAKRPWYFLANRKKIAIVAATQIERTYNYTKEATDTMPGVLKTLHADKFVEVIKHAKANSDYVIAFVHWGTEGANYYEADQVALAEQFVAAGADVIIGGHTHCLQGISYMEDVPIIYSLGNFWFGSTPTDGVNQKDTAIAQVIINKDGSIDFRFVPCVQRNRQTYLVTDPAEKARIIAFEQQLSQGVVIDADGYVSKSN
ncbi:MAG: CapA family protein [Eubacterium sp.]|nr:CapA family protein [Eubacterium sp.]